MYLNNSYFDKFSTFSTFSTFFCDFFQSYYILNNFRALFREITLIFRALFNIKVLSWPSKNPFLKLCDLNCVEWQKIPLEGSGNSKKLLFFGWKSRAWLNDSLVQESKGCTHSPAEKMLKKVENFLGRRTESLYHPKPTKIVVENVIAFNGCIKWKIPRKLIKS